MTTIGDTVIRWRKARGWTQEDLAALADMPQNHISAIETGRLADPRASTIEKLARAFGVSLDDLISGLPSEGDTTHLIRQDFHILRELDDIWEGLDDEQRKALLSVAQLLQRGNAPRIVE